MSKMTRAARAVLAVVTLSVAGTANADWLAVDPGTLISLQLNRNGALVIRPLGGTWSHAVCADVTAAELDSIPAHALAVEMLITAAANGSLVNVFAEAEECDEHGHPLVRNVRIQAP